MKIITHSETFFNIVLEAIHDFHENNLQYKGKNGIIIRFIINDKLCIMPFADEIEGTLLLNNTKTKNTYIIYDFHKHEAEYIELENENILALTILQNDLYYFNNYESTSQQILTHNRYFPILGIMLKEIS